MIFTGSGNIGPRTMMLGFQVLWIHRGSSCLLPYPENAPRRAKQPYTNDNYLTQYKFRYYPQTWDPSAILPPESNAPGHTPRNPPPGQPTQRPLFPTPPQRKKIHSITKQTHRTLPENKRIHESRLPEPHRCVTVPGGGASADGNRRPPTALKSPLPASLNPAAATELAHSQAIAPRHPANSAAAELRFFFNRGYRRAVGEVGGGG